MADVGNIRQQRQATCFLEDEEPPRVFLSLIWADCRLGAAYYDSQTATLYVMNDVIEEALEFAMTKKVVQLVNATCVITSSKSDARFLKMLKELAGGTAQDENAFKRDNLQFMPAVDFGLDQSRQRIMCLNVLRMPKMLPEREFEIYLSSIFSFDSAVMIRAVGGLLKYLDKKRIGVELEDPSVQVPVTEICPFKLADVLTMDENTIKALHIFRDEYHPSVYKLGSGMKEGLSLFGIFNQCSTPLGAKQLRLMFLTPSTNLNILQQRLQTVAFFAAQHNADVITSLRSHLRHVKNVHAILARMSSGHHSTADWFSLYKTMQNAIQIVEICRGQMQAIEIFKQISSSLTGNLIYLVTLMESIIDFHESTAQGRFVVKLGTDDKLDEMKRTYNGLPDFMTKVASQELTKLPQDVQECEVVYLPQIGFLISLAATEAMLITSDFTMPGLKFSFVASTFAYYKSEGVEELDELFGDIWHVITDYETSIMLRLQETVMEHSGVLLDFVKYSAQLDCFIAMALVAREFNFVRPQLTDDNVIQIINGRHPLQEMCVSSFVANDVTSGGPFNKVSVITGLNSSGKSVYLKQVALIVFLSHIGSFVPAKSAVIGTFDRIFTRIQTEECVSVGLSAFMIDLNQMALAVRCATSRSLVIIDEFGKGTNSLDGVSILAATVKYWQNQGQSSPHIFLSTHMYAIFSAIPQSNNISYLTTETLQDGEEMVFLYRIIQGKAENSCAHQVAVKVQLPVDVVQRSLQVTKSLRENTPIPPKPGAATTATRNRLIADRLLELDFSHGENAEEFLASIHQPQIDNAVSENPNISNTT